MDRAVLFVSLYLINITAQITVMFLCACVCVHVSQFFSPVVTKASELKEISLILAYSVYM